MPRIDKQCKICRRAGEKLFLKGERCHSPKCAMVRRNYPPGSHGQKKYIRLSSFGIQLKEKQKLKNTYHLSEKQLRNYMKKSTSRSGDTGEIILQMIESRLDNIVFRLGLAKSRKMAREYVSHGHFLVNKKKVNIPSYLVKASDEIGIREKSIKNKFFQELSKTIEKYETPGWLSLDKKNFSGKMLHLPLGNDLKLGIEVQQIIEFYSR